MLGKMGIKSLALVGCVGWIPDEVYPALRTKALSVGVGL